MEVPWAADEPMWECCSNSRAVGSQRPVQDLIVKVSMYSRLRRAVKLFRNYYLVR